MEFFELFGDVIKDEGGKIGLFVLDGVGGAGVTTELEMAKTPNLDELSAKSSKGLLDVVCAGVAPGSGPGHLALFGYDPLRRFIKRGVMEALGIGVEVRKGDVSVRGNFATAKLGERIIVEDRRAGRISTDENRRLCDKLSKIRRLEDVEISIYPVKEHRFCLIMRGDGLYDNVSDADPQKDGATAVMPEPLDEKSKKTARIAEEFIRMACDILKDEKANFILLRGFSMLPEIPPFPKVWKVKSAAVAIYPMYKGIARILGMDTYTAEDLENELRILGERFDEYDFIYFHVKKMDTAGEDGAFDRKVEAIEEFDSVLPKILKLGFDVICITGDHSTPSIMRSHSFHPVPLMLWSKVCIPDGGRFTEKDCAKGILGRIKGMELMPILLAHAGRLARFGA